MKLLLTNKTTLETIRCDEHRAAELMGLDVEQVEWAIEEYSRCDAMNVDTNIEYVAIAEEYEG